MTEKKPSFLDAIKAAQELKTKITPETAASIHQAKTKPKSQVTTNKPTTKNTGRGR
jgi:hypothetical protein